MYFNKVNFTVLIYGLILTSASLAESLTDIYQTALQNDPVLGAARANFKAGLETKKITRAALLPQIAASGEYSESESTELERIGYLGDSTSEGTRYGVSLSQAIFDMPSWYQFQSGKSLCRCAAQFSADQQRFIMRVSQAYLNVLRAYDNKETRNAEQRAIAQRLEQTKERFEVGLVAITDVHEAQAFFDEAVVNSLEAQGALNIAFEGLQVLTGSDHTVLSGLAESFKATAPTADSGQDWVDLAVKNNYQLRVAELGKDAAYSQSRAAAMVRLPKIVGTASYFDSDNEVISPFMSYDSLTDGHQFGVSITMPIWLGAA